MSTKLWENYSDDSESENSEEYLGDNSMINEATMNLFLRKYKSTNLPDSQLKQIFEECHFTDSEIQSNLSTLLNKQNNSYVVVDTPYDYSDDEDTNEINSIKKENYGSYSFGKYNKRYNYSKTNKTYGKKKYSKSKRDFYYYNNKKKYSQKNNYYTTEEVTLELKEIPSAEKPEEKINSLEELDNMNKKLNGIDDKKSENGNESETTQTLESTLSEELKLSSNNHINYINSPTLLNKNSSENTANSFIQCSSNSKFALNLSDFIQPSNSSDSSESKFLPNNFHFIQRFSSLEKENLKECWPKTGLENKNENK